jgi:hypothetical protein
MSFPPEVNFELTEEAFRDYERLLVEQGVVVKPMGRDTAEDLVKGTVSIFNISGVLEHDGREFPYNVQQDRAGHHLTVHAFDHGQAPGEALRSAIALAFPQPNPPVRPKPEGPQIANPWKLGATVGCFALIVLFGALCFFAVIGFRSFFR